MRVLAPGWRSPSCLVPGEDRRWFPYVQQSADTGGDTAEQRLVCPASQPVHQRLCPGAETVIIMKNLPTGALLALALVLVLPQPGHAQFFNAIRNLFSPVTNLFNGGRFVDDGTRSPQVEFFNFDIDTAMNTQYLE